MALPPPTPAELPRPSPGRRLRRMAEIGAVVAKHVTPLALQRAAGKAPGPQVVAAAMRRTFESLGSTFVKLGQLVASSPGVFGDTVSNEFRSCLDSGPPVPFPVVRETIEATIHQPLARAFATFDEVPLGRASIAVVHRATLADGRTVAVKVLRPRIARTVATDLELMRPLLTTLARAGIAEAGQVIRLLSGFREQVCEELDLRNEARAMAHYRGLLQHMNLPAIVVPEPYPALSGRRVLTMEFLDGVPFDDTVRIAEIGGDPRGLMTQMLRAWFSTALRDGTFHGDIHAGNILLLRDGRIGALDWGIVGRLDPDTHAFLRAMIRATLGDEASWDVVVEHVMRAYGTILTSGLGFDQDGVRNLVRGMVEPMLTQPFGEASLGQFLAGLQGHMGAPSGDAPKRTLGDVWQRMQRQRRVHATALRQGTLTSDFERGSFLLAKQLMYFERYGKMYLSDVPLLADREFFERALDDGPIGDASHLVTPDRLS